MKKLFLCFFLSACFNPLFSAETHKSPMKSSIPKFRNIIVIGWDGSLRERVELLLKQGQLPNLKSIIDHGSYVSTTITKDATETKPGWTQILTGYSSKTTGVLNNKFYAPIPKGLTVFERLSQKFGKKLKLIFLTGKVNNVGIRGPHNICMNCLKRSTINSKKTRWWDEFAETPVFGGHKKIMNHREGEPYYYLYNSKVVDHFQTALIEGPNVLRKAFLVLDRVKNDAFFAFIHFEEPDEQGHVFGENSKEYSKALMDNDINLGKMLNKLKELNLVNNTILIVTTDHGFDIGKHSHHDARNTFLVSTIKNLRPTGDRLDITPTIYELFDVDTRNFTPPIEGKSIIP
ncbi:MAG: alkaline phosphatase family protein [Bacteriovorax sp.]|nr:alkaline phosphatase family protein [Bacteriovorax sp.]